MNDQSAAVCVGSIETFSGVEFTLDEGEIRLIDVATGLSRMCRYVGHGRRFYSVAEHAVEVAKWLLKSTGDPKMALAGLHHDDWEAYVADVAGPWKRRLPDYQQLERLGDRRIAEAFDLPLTEEGDWPPQVKEADYRILGDEKAHLFPKSSIWWVYDFMPRLGIRLWPICPSFVAKWRYLRMHRKLTKMLGRD